MYRPFTYPTRIEAVDDVIRLLDQERRRYALYYLEEAGSPVSVDELAVRIADWEASADADAPGYGEFEDVVLTLEHQHLPTAAEVEFVEYDPEAEVVRMTGTPAEFDVVLPVSKAIEQTSDDGIRRPGDPNRAASAIASVDHRTRGRRRR